MSHRIFTWLFVLGITFGIAFALLHRAGFRDAQLTLLSVVFALGYMSLRKLRRGLKRIRTFQPYSVEFGAWVDRIAIENGLCTKEEWDAKRSKGTMPYRTVTIKWLSPYLCAVPDGESFSGTPYFHSILIDPSASGKKDEVNWGLTYIPSRKVYILYMMTEESKRNSFFVGNYDYLQDFVELAVIPRALVVPGETPTDRELKTTGWRCAGKVWDKEKTRYEHRLINVEIPFDRDR